jgi:hypothetical protein
VSFGLGCCELDLLTHSPVRSEDIAPQQGSNLSNTHASVDAELEHRPVAFRKGTLCDVSKHTLDFTLRQNMCSLHWIVST